MSAISLSMPFGDSDTSFLPDVISFIRIPTIMGSTQREGVLPAHIFDVDSFATSIIEAPAADMTVNVSTAEEIVRASNAKEKLVLERTILSFLSLECVDDEEAEEQLTAAVPEALVFLSELPVEAPLPNASLALDGVITLEWNCGAKKAAAIFEGEDDYGYTYYDGDRFIAGESTGVVGTGIPPDLNNYLTN